MLGGFEKGCESLVWAAGFLEEQTEEKLAFRGFRRLLVLGEQGMGKAGFGVPLPEAVQSHALGRVAFEELAIPFEGFGGRGGRGGALGWEVTLEAKQAEKNQEREHSGGRLFLGRQPAENEMEGPLCHGDNLELVGAGSKPDRSLSG